MNIDRYDPLIRWMSSEKLEGDAGVYISGFLERESDIPPFDFDRPQEGLLLDLASQPPGSRNGHSLSRFSFLAELILARAYQHLPNVFCAARTFTRLENFFHLYRQQLRQEEPELLIDAATHISLLEKAAHYYGLSAAQSPDPQGAKHESIHAALHWARLATLLRRNPQYNHGSLERAISNVALYSKQAGLPSQDYPLHSTSRPFLSF